MTQNEKTREELIRDVLLYFHSDHVSGDLYKILPGGKKTLQPIFLSLKTLGYIVRTNPYPTSAATFCITKSGRDFLKANFEIELPHPDKELTDA